MESLKRTILDALFPPHCVGCGKGGSLICSRCKITLPRHLPPFCSLCAKPFSKGEEVKRGKGERETGMSSPSLCFRCRRSPLAIEGIRSVFTFDDVAREAILRLKYKGLTSLAGPFGDEIGKYLVANPLPVDAIVSVPLHPRRLRERGYNQSALLARRAAAVSGLRLFERALSRIKDTPAQVRTMSAEERRRNVQGAFQAGGRDVAGLRVLLIDDVCTTGSTLEACSLALRAAGARAVWGLTLARET